MTLVDLNNIQCSKESDVRSVCQALQPVYGRTAADILSSGNFNERLEHHASSRPARPPQHSPGQSDAPPWVIANIQAFSPVRTTQSWIWQTIQDESNNSSLVAPCSGLNSCAVPNPGRRDAACAASLCPWAMLLWPCRPEGRRGGLTTRERLTYVRSHHATRTNRL